MMNTFVWNGRGTIKYKEKNFMVIYKEGYETIGCQCFKDCTCAEDNKIRDIKLYRVCGTSRKDRMPKPYNFNTFEDAMNRIYELKML